MPKAQAIQINWQFTGSAGIMQVEHTAECFGGAWFKSPLSTEVWQPRHIWRETAFQFAEVLALNGETYVVSVNEFSATCNWQVVGVQVEENRCNDRALRKAITLGSPRTLVSLPMCTLKRRSRSSRPTSRLNQWHAFTQFDYTKMSLQQCNIFGSMVDSRDAGGGACHTCLKSSFHAQHLSREKYVFILKLLHVIWLQSLQYCKNMF